MAGVKYLAKILNLSLATHIGLETWKLGWVVSLLKIVKDASNHFNPTGPRVIELTVEVNRWVKGIREKIVARPSEVSHTNRPQNLEIRPGSLAAGDR